MSLRARAAIASLAAITSWPAPARAQETAEPIELRYDADAGCPDRASFLREMLARTRAARVVERDGKRRFEVMLVSLPSGRVRGTLAVHPDARGAALRSVEGSNCADAAAALAFVAAVAIDPGRTAPASLDEPAPPVASVARRSWRWAVGLDAGVVTGPSPSPLLGAGLFVEMAWPRPGWLSPSARLSFMRALDESWDGGAAGQATFRFTAGAVELCPATLTATFISAAACASMQLGMIGAQGTRISMPEAQQLFWATPGLSARVAMALSPAFVEVQAGGGVPLRRASAPAARARWASARAPPRRPRQRSPGWAP